MVQIIASFFARILAMVFRDLILRIMMYVIRFLVALLKFVENYVKKLTLLLISVYTH